MVAAAGWPDKPPRMWLGSTAPSIHGGASKCADHSMRFGCVLQGVLRLERILGDAFLPFWTCSQPSLDKLNLARKCSDAMRRWLEVCSIILEPGALVQV